MEVDFFLSPKVLMCGTPSASLVKLLWLIKVMFPEVWMSNSHATDTRPVQSWAGPCGQRADSAHRSLTPARALWPFIYCRQT